MNVKQVITDIVPAAEISILFISAVFIGAVISYKFSFTAAIVYMAVIATLYGFALISRNKKTWLLKWGISVPGAFLVLLYFWTVHYSVRALNWVFPDYGRQSAGGRFADSFLLVVFSAMCLISGMISLFVKINDYDRFRRIQFIVTTVSAVATVCIVLILEKQFPSYEFIVM